MFDVKTRSVGESLVLDLAGPLGREGGEMVLSILGDQALRFGRLVLNFTGVTTMNTAGLGGILWAVRQASRTGTQVLAFGLSDHFRKVFHVMGLTQYIIVVADEAAALR